ncbi:hypothetical protein QEN19_003317 [Hanseniaspora menglaensis]
MILKTHKRNKSSVGSATSFVVKSVVKQFHENSDSDNASYVTEKDNLNKTEDIMIHDYSSFYQENYESNKLESSTDQAENILSHENLTQIKPPHTLQEPIAIEKQASIDIESISLPTNIFNILQPNSNTLKDSIKFHHIFSNSCIIKSEDDFLLKKFIAIIYNIEKKPNSFCCFIIDKYGSTFHKNLDISEKSKYYEAIHNLPSKHSDLNVSKCLAAAILQKYAYILEKYPNFVENKEQLNPITASKAIEKSELIETDNEVTPLQICLKIQQFSLLNERQISSNFIDVVYDTDSFIDKMEQNNYLVSFLGEQLEQLFNPLTEYSPEEMEQVYKPDSSSTHIQETEIVKSIIKELISVQTYFTIDLVKFLTKFIIPLRIAINKKEINNLSTSKFNAVFPPTIDEVTRINCIFLDALKVSSEYSLKELIKSVYQTIQYFYKAYTRHEAATKNFNTKLTNFLEIYNISKIVDTNFYNFLKIDTIINAPQEKLFKIKLILERLIKKKENDIDNPIDLEIKQQYNHILDIIDQFGIEKKDEDHGKESVYQQRVFTPSGKLLTELATNWPAELQYKWLKRKVVGIFDCINEYTGFKNCIVIFSDYIVCLELQEEYDILNNPLLSNILMNSLINEKPLPLNFPKLNVYSYCKVSDTLITAYGGKGQLRMDLLNKEKPLYLQLINPTDSTEYICELVTKACILCKSSAFHLFKQTYSLKKSNEDKRFNCYITAHDLKNFKNEKIKSHFAVFLNVSVTQSILIENGIYYGFFVNNVDDNNVKITILSQDISFEKEFINCKVEDFNKIILEKLTSDFFIKYYYSLESPLIKQIISINEFIVDQIQEPLTKLKNSVLLNKKELQRFSTIMNPNSPLAFSNQPDTLNKNGDNTFKNNHKLPSSPQVLKPVKSLQQIDVDIKPVTNLSEISITREKEVERTAKEVESKPQEPSVQKTLKFDTSNDVIITQKIETKDLINKNAAKFSLEKPLPKNKTILKNKDAKPLKAVINGQNQSVDKKRKKNRLSTFLGNIFGTKSHTPKTKTKNVNSDNQTFTKSLKNNLEKTNINKPLPKIKTSLPNKKTVNTKKTPTSSPKKNEISSPIKIQREIYNEGDIPRLNSNLDKNLFKEAKGSVESLKDWSLNNPFESSRKSLFTIDSDNNSNVPLVNANLSLLPEVGVSNHKIKEDYFKEISEYENKSDIGEEYEPSVFLDDGKNLEEDDASFVYEQHGNSKFLKISQSPSFRELFLKLEADLHPLSSRKNPNYWTDNSLKASELENERENQAAKNRINNLYQTVIIEEDEEGKNLTDDGDQDSNVKDTDTHVYFTPTMSQFGEFDADVSKAEETSKKLSLTIDSKIEKILTIPKHSPLEAHIPTLLPAQESQISGQKRKPERYGNKFKVIRHEESIISPTKSDFIASPTKTPQIKSNYDTITDDIKTMTLDGIFVDIVSPVKKGSNIIKDNSNRIVSDLKLDFNDFNSTSFNDDPVNNQELEPNSALLAVFKDSNVVDESFKEPKEIVEKSHQNKKFDIKSESFRYLTDFI